MSAYGSNVELRRDGEKQMISYTSIQFYINAALEVVAVLFLGILLGSCVLRKNKDDTKRPFCLFALDLILLLLCNLTTWVLDGMFVSPSYYPGLYKLDLTLTVFDFFFYCLAGVLFFNYLYSLIDSMKKEIKSKRKLKLIHTLAIYCVVMTGLFSTSMFTGWLYYFPENGYTYYTPAYWVFVIFSVPALWLSFIAIFKNRKLLGKGRTLVLLSYLILPMLMAVVDQAFSLSISYVILPLVASVIYVGIDIEQDREMLRQQAQIAQYETEKTEMKVNLMMSQIQPHFLYNTLSTIAHLCRHDPKDAENAVNEFSDYLSGNLKSINTMRPIMFETELEHVENYLKIQKRRFPQRLCVEYDIRSKEFRVPALALQPIVENAIKHGVEKRLEPTTIRIASDETDNVWLVTVSDDGPGFDINEQPNDERPHIGIASVKSRLANLVRGSLKIESEKGVGTTVTIIIPKNTEVNGK